MSALLATFLGVDADLVMLATVLLAAVATTIGMLAVCFFAWAPYVSTSWAAQFGVGDIEQRAETNQTSD